MHAIGRPFFDFIRISIGARFLTVFSYVYFFLKFDQVQIQDHFEIVCSVVLRLLFLLLLSDCFVSCATMSRLIVSYFVALICASACQAELSLLGTKSSIQIWTPIDCDDPILMRPVPPDSAPNATSSASSLTSSDCAWKRLQFDYRLLIVNQTQSNDIGSVPTINLISGELVATMDSALAGARLEFHVMTTESGQLSTLVPPGAPLQITSGSKSNLNYSFAALEVRQLNMQVLPSGVRVSLSSINSSSSRHANEPAEWIHIQILNGTWRLSRRLRIGQSLTFVRPVTSSQSTPAYSLCLSHLALSDRPVRLSVNNVLRPWNEQQVRPFRIQVQGQVTDGCSRSLVACRPPCLHGAHCHTDLYGLGHCGCESVGYSGHNCYFRTCI